MRRSVVVVLVLAVLVPPADAAAPSLILVSGPCLAAPARLPSWEENAKLLVSLVDATRPGDPRRAVRSRPRLDLGLFWGAPAPSAHIRPRDASQHGAFYPAIGRRPALIDLVVVGRSGPRVAPGRSLAILSRHGVPTRVASRRCRA